MGHSWPHPREGILTRDCSEQGWPAWARDVSLSSSPARVVFFGLIGAKNRLEKRHKAGRTSGQSSALWRHPSSSLWQDSILSQADKNGWALLPGWPKAKGETSAGPAEDSGARSQARTPAHNPWLSCGLPEVTTRGRTSCWWGDSTTLPGGPSWVRVSQGHLGCEWPGEAGPALLEGVRLFLLQRKKPTPKGTGRSARSAVTSLSSGLASSQQLEELSGAGPGRSSHLSLLVLPGSWQPDSLPSRPCACRPGWLNYWWESQQGLGIWCDRCFLVSVTFPDNLFPETPFHHLKNGGIYAPATLGTRSNGTKRCTRRCDSHVCLCDQSP
jgi:hypothetical protein